MISLFEITILRSIFFKKNSDSMIESTNRNLNDSIMLRRATSKPSFHMKLPSLNSPTIVAPVITID